MSCLIPSSCDAEDGVCPVSVPVLVVLKMVCVLSSSQFLCPQFPVLVMLKTMFVLTVQLPIHVMKSAPVETINRKSGGDNKGERKR